MPLERDIHNNYRRGCKHNYDSVGKPRAARLSNGKQTNIPHDCMRYTVQSWAPATLPVAAVLPSGWLQLEKECKQWQFTVLQFKVLRGLCNWRRLPDSPGREGRIATQRWGEPAFTQMPFALRARRCLARMHRQRGIICGQCHWYGTMSVLPSHVPSSFGLWNIEMMSAVRPSRYLRLRSVVHFCGNHKPKKAEIVELIPRLYCYI